MISASAALADCGTERVRRCVDASNTVVDNQNCESPTSSGAYHWYYGGTSGYVPVGGHVSGGSDSAGAAGADAATSHGVIGAAGEAHGAAGGEGAGAGE